MCCVAVPAPWLKGRTWRPSLESVLSCDCLAGLRSVSEDDSGFLLRVKVVTRLLLGFVMCVCVCLLQRREISSADTHMSVEKTKAEIPHLDFIYKFLFHWWHLFSSNYYNLMCITVKMVLNYVKMYLIQVDFRWHAMWKLINDLWILSLSLLR